MKARIGCRASLVASILLLIPFHGLAQYVDVGDDSDRIDIGTIEETPEFAQARGLHSRRGDEGGPIVIESRFRFRCVAREIAVVRADRHLEPYRHGGSIDSESIDLPAYEKVVPGTVGEALLDFVCGYLRKDPEILAMVNRARAIDAQIEAVGEAVAVAREAAEAASSEIDPQIGTNAPDREPPR